jgi:superfamily I DNA/RNA helicase
MEEAIAVAIANVKKWRNEDPEDRINSTCVIASSQLVRDSLARQFSGAGYSTSVIDASQNLSADAHAIHFATMHRAKGLEFDRVIVVAPASYCGTPLETEAQRKLIYVALTRAKRDAILIKT